MAGLHYKRFQGVLGLYKKQEKSGTGLMIQGTFILAKLWAASDHNLKQWPQTLIFPKKIYYKNKMFQATATALIILLLTLKKPPEI